MTELIKIPHEPLTLKEAKEKGFNPDDANMIARALYVEEYLHTDANTTITSLMLTYDVNLKTIGEALDLLIKNKEKYITGVKYWENTHGVLEVSDYVINGEPNID